MSARAPDLAGLMNSTHRASLCVVAVVPARNEASRIEPVLKSMPALVSRIIVVDDASEDGTGDVASRADARVSVVRHGTRRGVGAAIEAGYAHAFDAGADAAVVLAGDGQMDPADLPALLGPIHAGRADYVKGNRLAAREARACMSTSRWLGIHALSFGTRVASGLAVSDTQCGYTALTRAAWLRLRARPLWHGYGYPNDMLIRLAKAKLVVEEVPVRPVYFGKRGGMSARHGLLVVPYVIARAWWQARELDGGCA